MFIPSMPDKTQRRTWHTHEKESLLIPLFLMGVVQSGENEAADKIWQKILA